MNTTRTWPLAAALLAACTADAIDRDEDTSGSESSESGTETGGIEVDGAAVVERALDYPTFERINVEPRESMHGLAETVNMWVPTDYADLYRAVFPEELDATADFPPDTLIVKEHLDADQSPVGLTIMFKAPAGYDPEHHDWWWGNAGLDGSLVDEGRVPYCIDCHEPRVDADFVWGVPADNRP